MQASLAHVLQAYHRVLSAHSMLAAEDTHYYRLLIALSLRPEPGWWDRLQAQRGRTARQGMLDSAPRQGHRPGSAPAAQAHPGLQSPVQSSHGAAADLQQQCAARGHAAQSRDQEHVGGQQQGPRDTDWQEVAEEFLAQTACRDPQQAPPAQPSRREPELTAMPELPHVSSTARVSRRPLMVQATVQVAPAHSSLPVWHAHGMPHSSQPAGAQERHPLAERALNRQQSGAHVEQQQQQRRQSGLGEQQQDDTGSVQIAGLIHGRSYKLVPVQAHRAQAQRRELVASWLNEAAAAAASGQARQRNDPPNRERQRRRPSIGLDDHQKRTSADRDLHRRSSAGREQQRRVSVTQPARLVHQRGDAREHGRSLAKQGQWRSRSGSPLGRREHVDRSRVSRRSASPQPSHAGQSRQHQPSPISVGELKQSYAAWQRATQRLIDIGHMATQRRHWRLCKRAFEVSVGVNESVLSSTEQTRSNMWHAQVWHAAVIASHAREARSEAAERHWRLRCQAAALSQWREALQQSFQPYVERAERGCKARVLRAWRAEAEAGREEQSRQAALLQQAANHMHRRCDGLMQHACGHAVCYTSMLI
jgi:protein SFI1